MQSRYISFLAILGAACLLPAVDAWNLENYRCDDFPSNLPVVPPGVWNVSSRALVIAPLAAVRDVLFDFSSYPEWNPFVRFQTIADNQWIPLPPSNQTPAEDLRTVIRAQIPPLRPEDLSYGCLGSINVGPRSEIITAYDNITHVDWERNRWAWRPLHTGPRAPHPPDRVDPIMTSLEAERWTALSAFRMPVGHKRSQDDDDNINDSVEVTLYESREVYRGPVARLVRYMYGKGLQEGFDAMAVALKKRVEQMDVDGSLVVQPRG